MKILFADDETSIRKLVERIIIKLGHEPIAASNGEEALALFASEQPSLAILDIMMPLVDGYEICEHIKCQQPDIPILLLTAKGDIVDKRIGFRAGADDYLTKPFDPEELKLRIEALLRRASYANNDNLSVTMSGVSKIGGLEFDGVRLSVAIEGKEATLTPKEFQILSLLALNQGAMFSTEDLIDRIWGAEYQDDSINIPAYIRHIRAKIESDPSKPKYLKTAWGSGYYLA